jgi:hypothetical protein
MYDDIDFLFERSKISYDGIYFAVIPFSNDIIFIRIQTLSDYSENYIL